MNKIKNIINDLQLIIDDLNGSKSYTENEIANRLESIYDYWVDNLYR